MMHVLWTAHAPVMRFCATALLLAAGFELPAQSLFQTIKFFGTTAVDGLNPAAPLKMDSNGVLYGSTQQGGTAAQGALFKLNSDGASYVVIKNFAGNGDGADPVAGLLQASDGALYGTASWDHDASGIVSGNGTVFKINPDATGFQVLHHFTDGSDGANPLYGTLLQATNGLLYGTTMNGGANSQGVVFQIGMDGSNYLVIKRFGAVGGYHPYGGLIQATDGKLYGSTSIGGNGSGGTIFTMNLDGTGFTVLHSFGGSDGAIPYASLIQGRDGALYGTTEAGGDHANGTIFKLNMDGSGYAVLKSLDTDSGVHPFGSLVQGVNGVLYGTTSFRGNTNVLFGAGTLFQLNTDGSGFRVLKVFTQTGEGNNPHAGLLLGGDGETLYGTAWSGGPGGLLGSIFSFLPAAALSAAVSGQNIHVSVAGLANKTCKVQRSTDLSQPWVQVGTVTTDANGLAQFTDSTPPGQNAIYRVVQQ